jgi:GH25 family lysozyme M1 (1,4-beta-N-acetylmuramidase)
MGANDPQLPCVYASTMGDSPVTFRAGRGTGEQAKPAALSPHAALTSSAPVVLMADVSEFQADIADAVYLNWSKAVIIRAMYGADHVDGAWYGGQRREQLLAGGAQFLGSYQYLVASQDAATQARALASLLGHLNPGEYVIADIEEGAGPQQARWQAWANVIHAELGFAPGNYAGEYFAESAGLTPVDWIAAYQPVAPTAEHILWQFTDAYNVPGVGVADCSRFLGTIAQLRALAFGGGGATVPVPPVTAALNWTESLLSTLPTLAQGATGNDVRTVQGCLGARGHAVTIDGNFGPATASAVKALQSSAGVAADGIVGPVTWAKVLGR